MKSQKRSRSTSSSSGVLASPIALLASDLGLPIPAGIWPSSPLELLTRFGLNFSSSKTSPVCCRRTADGILEPCSQRWKTAGMGGPSALSTANISVSLNAAEDCSSSVTATLSQILETGDHLRRFYLTARACSGILRRAEKRGRRLPEPLRQALEDVVANHPN
jgi:hypothetical protein